ncbi:MarR family transcriptional regulator [Sulfitobacter sp. F26204]|nr:MarR family transcriptional regulator [Sulfitobacter sp. F26204]
MDTRDQIRALITRLARLEAAGGWTQDLNPAQRTALEYLARANRFSRSPSQVADFLGTTRGTASQTLKALMRKGLVREEASGSDKRSISYQVTDAGLVQLNAPSLLGRSLEELPGDTLPDLAETLRSLLATAADLHGARPFGVCKECQHFRSRKHGGHCALLQLSLLQHETGQICHEQQPGHR